MSKGNKRWLNNEVAKSAGSIKRRDVAVLLHTMVQKEGLPSTAEVTKIGWLNLKFDIIDGTLIVVA